MRGRGLANIPKPKELSNWQTVDGGVDLHHGFQQPSVVPLANHFLHHQRRVRQALPI